MYQRSGYVESRKRSEGTEQEVVIAWSMAHSACYPALKLLYHVPNGGKRNAAEAARLKRQGVKAGVPDLVLPVPKEGYHGLYIEMKWGKNKTTDEQDWWLEKLAEMGYKTAVCYGAEAAMDLIADYLHITKETGRNPLQKEKMVSSAATDKTI